MTIEKTTQGIRITSMVGTQLMTRHFIGYTARQAVIKFIQELKAIK